MAKILVMDDESSLRDILASTLKSMGHEVVTAEDGRQAIEIAKRDLPEIALLDIQVPDMDGIEVLRELKKLNQDIRGIILSGSADVDIAVSTIKQGASDFISKPFKIDEVKTIVEKVLKSKPRPMSSAPAPTAQPAASQVKTTSGKAGSSVTADAIFKKLKSKKLMMPGLSFAALLFIILLGKGLFKTPTLQEYSVPYLNPTGMCYIKPNLWVSDWVTGNIYKHKIGDKLSILSVYKTADTQPSGLAFTGDNIWSCNSIEQKIYKHNIDDSLTIKAIYASPNSSPAGMYFDGVNLWVLDSNTTKVYKYKIDNNLSVTGVYDSPAPNPCGMFRNGEYFYIGDYKTARVFKVSVKDFTVSDVYSIQIFSDMKYKLSSMTWDGKNIWAAADEKGKIFCLSFDALKPIKF
ncbi:MAG: response regulator [Elusimicrobia bacterium]|nr:response regulator [Candidatus Liberimonas magnetica]